MQRHLQWAKGGEARITALLADLVVLRSTIPAAPGSRLECSVAGEPPASLRVKVHSSKRQPDGEFVIEGRLLDATREVRERLTALLALDLK